MRLKAIYRLRFEHTTVMLCRVLHVNRSTYYNFINKKPSKREIENQRLRKLLLEIYMKAKKRIGTRAFKIILLRDYGVNISEGVSYDFSSLLHSLKCQPSNLVLNQINLLYFLLIICLNKNLTRSPRIKFGQQITLISL